MSGATSGRGAKIIMRVAGGLGVLLGLQAIVASVAVGLGLKQPSYVVLPALVAYNGLAGLPSVLAGLGTALRHGRALMVAKVVASAHTLVLLVLLAMRGLDHAVADHSLKAMVARSVVWWLIVLVSAKQFARRVHAKTP